MVLGENRSAGPAWRFRSVVALTMRDCPCGHTIRCQSMGLICVGDCAAVLPLAPSHVSRLNHLSIQKTVLMFFAI